MFRSICTCICVFLLCVASGAVFAGPPTQYPELNKPVTAAKTGAADVAVIVAIEDYIFLPKVGGATSNGNDWEKFFMDSLGVKTVHFLSNSQGTKEELERFAKIAAEGSQPGGTVWFVFIGHGAPAKDGKEGLLVGADARQEPNSLFARGIPQQDLLNILQAGQQAQTVLIVDACFSGRAGDGSALAPAQPVIPTTIAPKITDSTVVITAAEASEFAGSLPGANRPAFSYLLLGALQGWAADSSQTVSAKQAQMYVQRALRGIPGRMSQTPSIHGNGDIVLTRGVPVGDPGIKGLMQQMARVPTANTLVGPSPTIIQNNTTGLDNVPLLPEGLNPNGAIGLNVDAEVLVARDRALGLDESGASDPDAAAKAWREVAGLGGANPYTEEAAVRALQWEDFAKKQRDFLAQKSADFERLTQILPLPSVTEENKVQLLTNYGGLYGEADMVNLISVVQPADVRARLCAPYLQSGTSPLRVDMPVDRDGEPFKGDIVVAGVKFGKAPAMINLPSCATSMPIEVKESESGKVWAGVVPGLGGSDPTIISPEYEDLIPWSFWHDYLTASSPSGPLIGVMFSQMTLPSEFNRSTVQSLRGNVELGVGGGWAGDFSLWFEPSMSIEDSGVERAIGLAGGLGLGRFSAGRFSLSPLRVGYQKFLKSDIDGMEGFTGHAALRFHVGGGVQLRGDAGVLRAAVNQSGQDVEGWAWSAGGGLEYGHPVIYNAVGSLFESEGNSSSSDEWTEWTDGSLSFGYNVAQGYLPKQDFIGTMIFMTKGIQYDDGAYVSIEGAYTGLLGLDSTNFALRMGMAAMNDDEDIVYQLGFIGAYNGFEESDYYMLGMEGELAYHLVSQLSIHGYVSLNALALTDTEGETKDEITQEVIGKTTTMSPVSLYLRWVTPANIYLSGGVRADITGSMPISGFGEAGYVMSLE